ncbi:MAG: hypothetical protein IJ856_03215 [Candidatus Methanomethylophilaceae archaeon]|nr:hypothetical protein [Candidatus Methanomethylophilaceae archaeon]
MNPFVFRLVPADGADGKVPVAVAGQCMIDVQHLITDIGSALVSAVMRTQGVLDPVYVSKFELKMDGPSDDGMGAGPGKGSDSLVEQALSVLESTLDYLGKGAAGSWMEDTFPEPVSRRKIARDLLALADNMSGFTLMYGSPGEEKAFSRMDRDYIEGEAKAKVESMRGYVICVVVKDPSRKNRWYLVNSDRPIPVTFAGSVTPADRDTFVREGPLIAVGTVYRRPDGTVSEVRNVDNCYSFPSVKFFRIITSERDIELLVPAVATPGYDRARGMWRLTTPELGINISKPTWDECVRSYHDYFGFLWETYVLDDREFEGDEREVSDLLKSMASMV